LRAADLPEVSGPEAAPAVVFDDPVSRFATEAVAVSSDLVRVPDEDGVFGAVAAVFDMADAFTYLAWDGLDEVVPGFDAWAEQSGYVRTDATIDADPQQRMADTARTGGVSVGITGADWGVAASGSVVLCHGPGRPRSASLLVKHHVVLLPVDRVMQSLSDALERVGWDGNSNIAVITGPSRTGDIESIHTLGVHGPRRLHIVLIG
jgi:L-lactate dehydrogenase complex protein LldG